LGDEKNGRAKTAKGAKENGGWLLTYLLCYEFENYKWQNRYNTKDKTTRKTKQNITSASGIHQTKSGNARISKSVPTTNRPMATNSNRAN
jgi:hypothetical protein